MTGPSPQPKFPLGFVILTFALAGAVGAVVIYLGVRGLIGTGIP